MSRYLIATWKLLCILVLGFCILFSGLVLYLIYAAVKAAMGDKRSLATWHGLDVFIASIMYRTRYRSISSIVGGKALQREKGYIVTQTVIDWLAGLFGDGPNHCYRAYHYEIQDPRVKEPS